MTFTIKTIDFSNALQKLAPVCPIKTINPVLKNVFIKAENDELTLSTSDLDIEVTLKLPAQVDSPGVTTVPVVLLIRTIKQIAREEIRIDFDDKASGGTFNITPVGGRKNIKFATLNPASFPVFDSGDLSEIPEVEIDTVLFFKCITKTFHAICYDPSKAELNGIALLPDEEQGNTLIAATDGKRLAFSTYPEVLSKEQLIIPAKAVDILKHNIAHYGKAVFSASRTKLKIVAQGFQITARLIDALYPNIKQVIPKSLKTEIKLNVIETVNAINFTSIITAGQNKQPVIRISIENEKLLFNARSADVGEAEVLIESENQNEKYSLSFNPRFLADAVNSAAAEEVSLGINADGSPILINADNYTAIVMPLRI